MELKEWQDVLEAWKNVVKAAEISLEQAKVIMPAVEAEVNRLTEQPKNI